MSAGKFIVIEGLDGVGKSTQAAWLETQLRAEGQLVVKVQLPGTTRIGELLRTALKQNYDHIDAATSACMMLACFRNVVDTVIRPAVEAGKIVIADRFTTSLLAYQGNDPDGISSPEWILANLKHLKIDIKPNVTLFLDLPVEAARRRILLDRKRKMVENGRVADSIENQSTFVWEKRDERFRKYLPEDAVYLDAAKQPVELAVEIHGIVTRQLNLPYAKKVANIV